MPTLDPRIDAYIDAAPAFARPILRELRARVHVACPDVVETLKWRAPAFECDGLLGGMAAFKAYCSFGFWKEPLLREDPALAAVVDAVGRIPTLDALPTKTAFARALARARRLNADGVVVPRAKAARRPATAMHPELARALAASKKAQAAFDAFPPSHRREYIEWIADAKKDETRARRIEQAVEWIAAGRHRNWKYER